MPKKKTPLDHFCDLTREDIEEWAGGKIASRGREYQRQGRVFDLVSSSDGNRRYPSRTSACAFHEDIQREAVRAHCSI